LNIVYILILILSTALYSAWTFSLITVRVSSVINKSRAFKIIIIKSYANEYNLFKQTNTVMWPLGAREEKRVLGKIKKVLNLKLVLLYFMKRIKGSVSQM
jgi:hypothetical protein